MINKKVIIKLLSVLVIIITFLILLLSKALSFEILKGVGIVDLIILTICVSCLLFISPTKKLYNVNILGSDDITGIEMLDYLTIFTAALLFVQIMFAVVFFPATVNQSSMYPNFHEGDKIIVVNGNKKIERFDVVVFKVDKSKLNLSSFDKDGDLWIKRVIGLPGEQVVYLNGHLYVNNELIIENYLLDDNNNYLSGSYLNDYGYISTYNCYTNNFNTNILVEGGVIPDDYFLLLGDNRSGNPYSHDSREIGLVHRSLIIGEGKYIIESVFHWNKIGE